MTPEQERLLHANLSQQFGSPTMPPAPIGPSSYDVASMGPNLDSTIKSPPVGPAHSMVDPTDIPPPAEPMGPPPIPALAAPSPFGKPVDKVVSSHPGLTDDELKKYLDQQRGQMDKFGPDQQKMVMDDIQKNQAGPVHTVARGGAALADGLMQGVARAGNSNWLASIDRRDQNTTENALAENKALDDSNLKHISAGQSMDQMDPNSPIGRAMLQTYGPLLDKMGIPKDKQAHMLPALISTMTPELVKHEDNMAKLEAVKAQRELGLSTRQDQYDQNLWVKLGDKVNGLNAGSRKALGIAASANMRADRLLRTAMNPDATPQDIHNMIADIQGIYKGGVPDEISLKHGQYNTLRTELANIGTMLSSKPQAAHQPEVIAHLAKITRELKEIDNKVLSDNLGINKVIFDPIIKKDPERWQQLTGAVMQTGDEPLGKPVSGAIPSESAAPVIDSAEAYNALPKGASYMGADGKKRVKK